MLATIAVALLAVSAAPTQAEMSADQRRTVLQDAQATFDAATQLAPTQPRAATAAYEDAAAGFRTLIADGVHNGKLYYNLGNTYLQLGDLGRAILNYRRAERLIGNDAALQANLNYARSLRRNQIAPSGEQAALHTVFFWHYETPLRWRWWTAIGAYTLFWGLLAVRAFVRAPGTGYAAIVMLVVFLAAGASSAVELTQREHEQAGVTVQDDIVVRKGNGEAYDPQFEEALHEGVEFQLIEERAGWYKIELPDGSAGWIRQAQAEIV